MNPPLVSVIVPTIGKSSFFSQALESLAAQSYPNIEFYVSDNASDQPISREDVEHQFRGRQVRFVRRPERMPFADHFNACLREAEGRYAMFLSDDDLLVPRFVETAVKCIESDPQIGVVISRQPKLDESFLGGPPDEELSWETAEGDQKLLRWIELGDEPDWITCVSLFAERGRMLEVGGFGDYYRGSYSDIRLMCALSTGRRIGILSGGFLYRVYPSSNGLGMNWAELGLGTRQFEKELVQWCRDGRIGDRLLCAFVRSNTATLMGRYRSLYAKRPGFRNRLVPVVDLLGRLFFKLLRHGPTATPVLHRWARRSL